MPFVSKEFMVNGMTLLLNMATCMNAYLDKIF